MKLPRSFYARSVLVVARECIGKLLVHRTPEGEAAGRIVEAEAYRGPLDLAAHSARGLTRRTTVMFGPPGYAYVYLIYGLSWAMNIIVAAEGEPHGVLIRALEPVRGLDLMVRRRGGKNTSAARELTNGPGKLTQALGITRKQYGQRLDRGALTIRRWKTPPPFEVEVTPRIGISECVDLPLRFVWKDNPFVSRH